ncbi:uncharacterized protein LOC142557748 isoform X2 [Dermacentor variabilis]|uniref:uncharacterized protein LOC142557748 isoform X2 n=1 Tax=Dermacentor variabilis TaxID=34621 RepID=UPI003F5C9633
MYMLRPAPKHADAAAQTRLVPSPGAAPRLDMPMRKTMAATAATTMLSVPTARAMCAPSRALEILAAVVLHSRWFLVGAERGRRGMVRCQVLTRSAPFLLPGQHRVLSRRAVPSAHARLCHL